MASARERGAGELEGRGDEEDHRQEDRGRGGIRQAMTYRLNMATICFYKDGFTGISVQVLTEML